MAPVPVSLGPSHVAEATRLTKLGSQKEDQSGTFSHSLWKAACEGTEAGERETEPNYSRLMPVGQWITEAD
jgi:hypothetical protein